MAELEDSDGWETIIPNCKISIDSSNNQLSYVDTNKFINQHSKSIDSNTSHHIIDKNTISATDNSSKYVDEPIDNNQDLYSDNDEFGKKDFDYYNKPKTIYKGGNNHLNVSFDGYKNFSNSKKKYNKENRKFHRQSFYNHISTSNSFDIVNGLNLEKSEKNLIKPTLHNNEINLREIIKSNFYKIQILQIVVKNNPSSIQIVKLQFKSDQVIIMGKNDEDIKFAQIYIYEILSKIDCIKTIDLKPHFIKLINQKYSRNWLNKKIHEKNKFIYISNDCQYYSYQCTSDDIKFIIENIVVSKSINLSFKPDNLIKSTQWLNIQTPDIKRVVAVVVDEANIYICGCYEEVKKEEREILKLLEDYMIITETITIYKGQVELLRKNIYNINSAINDVYDGKVTISHHGLLKVSGPADGVKIAKSKIDEFVNKIVNEKFTKSKPGLTLAAFTENGGEMSIKMAGIESQHNVAIEVKLKIDMAKQPHTKQAKVASTTFSNDNEIIEVKKGDITKFAQADALVNPICKNNLENAGIICKQFMKSGGQILIDEVAANIPTIFGSQPYVTKAYGSQNPTSVIYHVCLRQYKNIQSFKLLTKMIEGCIYRATNDKLKSIAFPTVGCGHLKYASNDVINCFKEAVQNTKCNIKIYIVVFENDLHDLFLQHFSKSSLGDKFLTHFTNFKYYFSTPNNNQEIVETLEFRINALTTESLKTAKKVLEGMLDHSYLEKSISDNAISQLNEAQIKKILRMGGKDVNTNIDVKNNQIILSGESKKLVLIQEEIYKMVGEHKEKVDLRIVKKMKGLPAFFKQIIETSRPEYPKYWSNKKSREVIVLNANELIYLEVLNLVMKTWDKQKVGQGQDAIGLRHTNISVTKISMIQDECLYFEYFSELKKICMRSGSKVLPRVQDIQNEKPIYTESFYGNLMKKSLIEELNECFLFHGTKKKKVPTATLR